MPPEPGTGWIIDASADLAFGVANIVFDRPLAPGVPDNSNWIVHADGEQWEATGVGNIVGNSVMINIVRTGLPTALQVVDYVPSGVPITDTLGNPAPEQTNVPLTLL